MGEEVKLHGTWESPFSFRVIWDLKLKGIAYEYVEEDLINKNALLIYYNPVHKKIHVLVHAGKPGLAVWRTFRSTSEELEKAIKESLGMLEIVEEHGLLGDNKYFNGEKIGMVDI
ncbi:hypothetical protein Ddye_019034 [Dipteronia dyeriana]|uniref:Glutathione S-transferase n=1 Tax=Dipteronia dyeriana TaxID=168575 RepID=A0AAD9TX15_9ROSI|nr:hypothetical protein Ddye_019034 [Dipteronia dyeriana]